MDNPMIKSQNPDKEYPSNTGQKWSDEEETLLLEELSKNIDIQLIAQYHNRTIGGINARRKVIAYKLYINNNSMEEIILKTKLDEELIKDTIKKQRQNNPKKCKTQQIENSINKSDYIKLQNDVKEIKNDIAELKKTIKELIEMMKAVYEFENT